MRRLARPETTRLIVLREAHPGDGRGVRLTLTRSGRKAYDGLIRAAAQRDSAFRGCLTRNENQAFDRILTKLAGQARELIATEKAQK